MRRAITPALLCAHVLILNGLFGMRDAPDEYLRKSRQFVAGEFRGTPLDYLRLYNGQGWDVEYYYEWSTVALGKGFEPSYPLAHRSISPVRAYFDQPPQFRAPYRDLPFEYPPLLTVPLLAARTLSRDFLGFTRVLALFISAAYLGALGAGYAMWRLLPPAERLSWPVVLGLSAASLLFLGTLWVTRLDVFPSLLYVLSLRAFLERRPVRSALWLAAGVLTKAYAILLAPLLALCLYRQRRHGAIVSAAALVIAVVGGVNLLLGAWAGAGYWDSFRYHASRGIQIESLYASWPLLRHLAWGTPVRIFDSHGGLDVEAAGTGLLLAASSVVPMLVAGAIYLAFLRLPGDPKAPTATSRLLPPAVLLVFAFVVTFKVLSPQFLIWLMPLIFLWRPRRPAAFFSLFLFMLLLTQLLVPNFYFLLEHAHPAGILLVTARNVALVTLCGWVAWDWLAGSGSRPIPPASSSVS